MENVISSFMLWVKQIFVISIFSGLLIHIVPSEKYQKYIRFICGVLLTVICISPLITVFGKDKNSYNDVYKSFIKLSEAGELQSKLKFKEGSQKALFSEYEAAVTGQIEERVLSHGLKPTETKVVIDWDGDSKTYGTVQKITVRVHNKDEKAMISLKKELAEYYDINMANVSIY